MTSTDNTAGRAKEILFLRSPFSKPELLTLFLVIAFPINFWAMIIWFRNYGSIAEELSQWDAIGVGAYILLFALVEILIVFIIFFFLSLVIPIKWRQERILSQTSVLYLLISAGLILDQSRSLIDLPLDSNFWRAVNFINLFSSSLVVILVIGLALAIGLVVVIHRFERVSFIVRAGIEKIVVLSGIYLVLDMAAVLIIIIRNF